MPLTEVILDFTTLRGTKPQVLTPKGTTITLKRLKFPELISEDLNSQSGPWRSL